MNVFGPKNSGMPSPTSVQSRPAQGKDKTSSFESFLGQKAAADTAKKPEIKNEPLKKETYGKDDKPSLKKDDKPQVKSDVKSKDTPARQEAKSDREVSRAEDNKSAVASDKSNVDKSTGQKTVADKSADTAGKSSPLKAGSDKVDAGANQGAPVAGKVVAASENAEAEALPENLPGTSGFPTLGVPTLNDRAMNAPVGNVAAAQGGELPMVKSDEGDSLARRVVWNDFLRKMGEIGVSVEDVVEAFSKLSVEQLNKPPEQSVDAVAAALGLNPQQTQLAKQFLTELVDKTQAKSMGDELRASSKNIDLTLMTQRELERKQLAKGLDTMNRGFFREPTIEQAAKGVTARDLRNAEAIEIQRQSLAEQSATQRSANEQTRPEEMILTNADFQKLGLNPNATGAAEQAATLNVPKTELQAEKLAALVDKMNAAGEEIPVDESAFQDLMRSLKAPSAQTAAAYSAPAANVAPQAAEAASSSAQGASAAPRDAMAALNQLLSDRGNNSADRESKENLSEGSAFNNPSIADARMAGQPVRSEFQSQLAQANGAQAPQQVTADGIPDLVENAQIMLKDGGGEMKVTMTPEGLGEIAMRVSVEGGKVQVQMITESDEAKKLIEKSIGDLKSGLAQNNLQVDTIKVDTASNLGKQLEQQYAEGQRQQAQQNLQQFRQDTQGWRRSFFETPNVRGYKNQGDALSDVSAPNTTASNKRASSRRLNLVA